MAKAAKSKTAPPRRPIKTAREADTVRAVLTVHDAAKLEVPRRQLIAAWLRDQATRLEGGEAEQYDAIYTARYRS